MKLTDALTQISSARKPILFLGAGFAMLAKNSAGEDVPSGRELGRRLGNKAGLQLPAEAPLSFVADKAVSSMKPKEILDFLNSQLTMPSLTDEQRRILSLPWHRIYTTNFDNAGELAGLRCIDAATDNVPSNPRDYIMLHGSLKGCTVANYYQRLKIGEQLYVSGSHSKSQYHSLLHQDIHECDCLIVIGYSLSDPDLANIFYASADAINKCFVYSGPQDGYALHRIELIGNNTGRTAEEFVQDVDARPAAPTMPYPASVTAEQGGFDSKAATQLARQGLLMFGRYDRNMARTGWNDRDAPSYAIERSIAEEIAKIQGPATILVHAHLGNGKTLLLEQAKFLAASGKRPCFTIDRTMGTDAVRSALMALPDHSTVFFEGYVFMASELQEEISAKGHVFCVVCRTTTLRVAAQKIYAAARGKSLVRTFDANKLKPSELASLARLIGEMSFWPTELASKSEADVLDILNKKYDSSMCAVVLKIFENDVVREKVDQTWSHSKESLGPLMDRFVATSYLTLIDVDVPPYLFAQFQSADFERLRAMETDILRVDASGKISFSNNIIGEYIFHQFANKEPLIGAVVRFANFLCGHYAA